MAIPPKFLDELRARLTLSDVVGKRIRLTRAGREFKACCPFHKEKTPSFTLNDTKGFYYCFGCGAKGDVLKFVMQHDNLEFRPAVEMLAAEAGMAVPDESPQERAAHKKQKDLYDLMDDTAQWFAAQLGQSRDVLEYVKARGLDEDAIGEFHIGYAPDDYDALKNHLKAKSYTESQMLEAGVLKKSERDGKTYSFFRGRVMIPVLDMRGRVVAFGGRILPESLRPPERGDFKPPKYINSPETSIFNKSATLYGGYQARLAAGQGKTVVVVEGYFDAIACHRAGFTGAVAPMGTALTEEQIMLLWKMIPAEQGLVKEPVLCFDGDNAGRRAAERACALLLPMLASGQSARFAFLPDGEDPDTLIGAGGPGAFQKTLNAALPLFDFLWQLHTAGRSFKTPDARAALMKALNADITLIPDRALQNQYDRLLKDRFYKTFAGFTKGKGGKVSAPAVLPRPVTRTADFSGRILLAALVNYPELCAELEDMLWQIPLTLPGDEAIRSCLMDIAGEGLDSEALQAHIKGQAGLASALDDLLSPRIYTHGNFCKPGGEAHIVRQKWHELWAALQARSVQGEVRSGWRQAFAKGDVAEEDRLRLLRAGADGNEDISGTY